MSKRSMNLFLIESHFCRYLSFIYGLSITSSQSLSSGLVQQHSYWRGIFWLKHQNNTSQYKDWKKLQKTCNVQNNYVRLNFASNKFSSLLLWKWWFITENFVWWIFLKPQLNSEELGTADCVAVVLLVNFSYCFSGIFVSRSFNLCCRVRSSMWDWETVSKRFVM